MGYIMAKYLVIVESPTKVKTIKKFLGKNYEIMASTGHVRDLPKSQLGFDPEHDYEPKYITIRGKGEVLAALRKEAKKADKVFLATDPDREGEAISWHLQAALNLAPEKTNRITFNEITKSAVKEALKHPRQIDMNMVDAQQTRRILDRMVGYRISPLLWAKIRRGLSAGRVQSVALRIIAKRENEISEFIPQEFWTLGAEFALPGLKSALEAQLAGKEAGGKYTRISLAGGEQTDAIKETLSGSSFWVSAIKKGERTRKAPLPFTTSTLQQEAAKSLNFPTQKTMRLAQQLYEGVDLAGSGTVGLITYLRTDSTRISDEANDAAAVYISSHYGEAFLSEELRDRMNRPGDGAAGRKNMEGKVQEPSNNGVHIQDAHEAIRPSDISRTPAEVKEALTRDQFRLYQLIWKRFVGSRMAPAKYETLQIRIASDKVMESDAMRSGAQKHAGENAEEPQGGEFCRYIFTTSSSRILSEGYLSVYTETDEEKKGQPVLTEKLTEGEQLALSGMKGEQHFTQPPAHYTEASLVHALEELGIGRPSTYAPTITTLLARHYVTKEKRNLYITELGTAVDDILRKSFPEIDNVQFTAYMESMLDSVAEGRTDWKTILRNFYPDLDKEVQHAEETLSKVKVADEVSDVVCDKCGRHMVVKYGPHGKFLACPGFPECRNTKPYFEKAGVTCPKCGQDVVIRRSKKGRIFYGCSNPECDFISWNKPSTVKCPECGSYMVEKGNRLLCSNQTCGFILPKKAEEKDNK